MAYNAEYQRAYRESHKEEMAEYRLKNKGKISLQRKEYRDRNREEATKEPGTMTRREAIELKLDRYFTGRRCINGHLSERTMNNGCCQCWKDRVQRRSLQRQTRG